MTVDPSTKNRHAIPPSASPPPPAGPAHDRHNSRTRHTAVDHRIRMHHAGSLPRADPPAVRVISARTSTATGRTVYSVFSSRYRRARRMCIIHAASRACTNAHATHQHNTHEAFARSRRPTGRMASTRTANSTLTPLHAPPHWPPPPLSSG